MSVFPQYFCAFGREFGDCGIGHQMQPDLASMKRKYPLGLLGYPWSKLVTEQALLFAQSAGLPVGDLPIAEDRGDQHGTCPAERPCGASIGRHGRCRTDAAGLLDSEE